MGEWFGHAERLSIQMDGRRELAASKGNRTSLLRKRDRLTESLSKLLLAIDDAELLAAAQREEGRIQLAARRD